MKKIIITLLIALSAQMVNAYSPQVLRMHCEKDTTKIEALLAEGLEGGIKSGNGLIAFYAEKLLGTPYVAHTLEGEQEDLSINIDQLDCTTFVETLAALSRCTMTNRRSWRDFASMLENIRYKGGKIDGYASRLHYISAWVIDNTTRGNLKEVTGDNDKCYYVVKTLNFMSRHRDKYEALKDDDTFEKVRGIEIGFFSHRYPILKKSTLKSKSVAQWLRDGDIIAITTNVEGLDVSHMGVVKMIDGVPHLLHASMTQGEVIIDKDTLYDMLAGWRSATGIRVIRLIE